MKDSGISGMKWSRHPASVGEQSALSDLGDDGEVLDVELVARVLGLGAICGLRNRRSDDDGQSQGFWVGEFVLLANGRRVLLHEERGFTIGLGGGSNAVQDGLSLDTLTQNVLSVILPGDDTEDSHPWSWLADLARLRGLDVNAEQLRALPYKVVFTPGAGKWLRSS